MYIYKYLPILTILLILSFVLSCKLLTPDDTTPPQIQLSIEGGNEISRGVTLYLDINDDSKIDYVSVIIDDTTAITVESNFNTISFDVTPFADESEHILYVEVSDNEGNIGESEKIDVVITEFPGWRIYNDLEVTWQNLVVDDNGLLWFNNQYEITIFNPMTGTTKLLTSNNSELPNFNVEDIEVIDGSRVWIVTKDIVSEYHYDFDRWITHLEIPKDPAYGYFNASCAVVDKNYDLWIGTHGGLLVYKNSYIDDTYNWHNGYPTYSIWDMVIADDGTIHYSRDGGIYSFKNGEFIEYDDFPYSNGWDINKLIVDKNGHIWTGGNRNGGALMYNGVSWEIVYLPKNHVYYDKLKPQLSDSNGNIYATAYGVTGISQYGSKEYTLKGLVCYDGTNWIRFDSMDSPFNIDNLDDNTSLVLSRSIAETPNGDIWMGLNGKLTRYRPSLGGYP